VILAWAVTDFVTPWNVKSPVTVLLLVADLLDRFALERDQRELLRVQKIGAFDILIDLETRSHNRPQRERLPCFKTGISVVNKVELAVVIGTGERSPFSGS
jgi:hypothetical protein